MYLCKFATGEETESRKILETNILKTLPKPGPIPATNINRFFMSKNKRRPQPQPQPILEPEKQTGEENLAPQPPVPKEENKKNGHYLRREFSYSKFQQTMVLPDNVDKEKISASVKDGVLTIDLPKLPKEEPVKRSKQIEIK